MSSDQDLPEAVTSPAGEHRSSDGRDGEGDTSEHALTHLTSPPFTDGWRSFRWLPLRR
jgi:hypothetical protein